MKEPRIRRLPDHLVNKIAAGEVVERPASVVKELVDNAIDADSATITVDLKDAGRQLIRVSDDGMGMTAEEVDLALLRHATSKLATDADLEAIETLGFRGEALPAVCAVTRFSVLSCPRGSDTGTLVRGEGGRVGEKLLVAASPGTTVEAHDLFFNTPARLKFLKSAQTELSAALRLLEGVALARAAIHLRVTHEGRPVLTAPRARTLRDRVGAVWGFERAGKMLEVDWSDGELRVSGLVGPPQLARGNRDGILLIVNGRHVRDTMLSQTLLDAYRPLLARDQFPVAVLHIELPSRDVDVNVHPTKAWVRFRAPRLLQEGLFSAVKNALGSSQVVQGQRGLSAERGSVGGDTPGLSGIAGAHELDGADSQGALFREAPARFGSPGFGGIIGQLQDTFIVTASEEEVFFIDQHVAHERVLFERLDRELELGPLPSQQLLFPQPVELAAGQAGLVGEWRAALERLGFTLEAFGSSAVLVRAVPHLLRGEEPRRLIEGLLEEVRLAEPQPRQCEAQPKANRGSGYETAQSAASRADTGTGTGPSGARLGQAQPLVHRALSFIACRAAIKAHMPLQRDEMTRLVADLSATATPYFCPHGRPIVSRLSLREIKRELGRTW